MNAFSQRTQSRWLNRNDLMWGTVYKGVGRVKRANRKWRSQMVVTVRSCQRLQGWRDKRRRWFHQSLGARVAKGRAAWGTLGPRRKYHCQKYCPQREKEGHTLASPHLPHSKLLPMPLLGQTSQKPFGKEAWAKRFAGINPQWYKMEQGEQMREI